MNRIYHLFSPKWKETNCILFFFFSFIFFPYLSAQVPEYYMSNQTVHDCEGILFDSELNDVGGNYGHNEDFIFSICPQNAKEIALEFTEFCTEQDFDFLTIYDGPDTLSPQVGRYHGEQEDPAGLVTSSGCITFHFISDPNVACTGWAARWETEFDIPVAPNILPIPQLDCQSNAISINFDTPIPCDSVFPAAFTITGPQFPEIVSAIPISCVNGMTQQVDLAFEPTIDFSGNYQIRFVMNKVACTTNFILQSVGDFSVTNCPLKAVLEVKEEIGCAGDTIILIAEVGGGVAGTYQYDWTPTAPNTNEISIITNDSITYSVVVTDELGATATASLTLHPLPLPIIQPGDTSFCQSIPPFFLKVDSAGGHWFGQGIIEPEKENGLYDPGLVTGSMDTIRYEARNGCIAEVVFEITALDEGTDDASCPGAANFMVSGGLPIGGIWSGENISPEGVFKPTDTTASFEVTYTHPNGCTASKVVNIGEISLPIPDSFCQSIGVQTLTATPFGGLWEGNGIVDIDLGEFHPDSALSGFNQLTYSINGCKDSTSIYITEIAAFEDFSTCSEKLPFVLPGNWHPQTGGIWQGLGIVDSLTGLYDPALVPDGTADSLIFSANGCVDNRIVNVQNTEIQNKETLQFCLADDPIELIREEFNWVPEGGIWSGAGIENPEEDTWFFNPIAANEGSQYLIYEKNACMDSLMVTVHARPKIDSLSVCEKTGAIILSVEPEGGIWEGPGIVNGQVGIFDPAETEIGINLVSYESDAGCFGEAPISVLPFQEVTLDGIENSYCYKDSQIILTLLPENGQLWIDDSVYSHFNPAVMGTGIHSLQYIAGEGACQDMDSRIVEVGEPLEIILPEDTDSVCYGETVQLMATGRGGSPFGNYSYTWDIGTGQSQTVEVFTSQIYTVVLNDGCSEPVSEQFRVEVHPQITTSLQTGETVCFNDTTYAIIRANPPGNYTYIWNTSPITFGDSLSGLPTTHLVEVIHQETGCKIETEVKLPGYELLEARFGLSPNNEGCLSTLQPDFDLIDFSQGGQFGYWDFGDDSEQIPYIFGEDMSYAYPEIGNFEITLHLENEDGCMSDFTMPVCVEEAHQLYAPNIFSPNADGHNDSFQLHGLGIQTIQWQVYNRWGQLVFQGYSLEDQWDGTHLGNPVDNGVYLYVAEYQPLFEAPKKLMSGDVTVVR